MEKSPDHPSESLNESDKKIHNQDSERLQDGLLLYNRGKFNEALDIFEKITTPSLQIMKNFHKGLCLIQMGKLDEGLQAYRQIREIPAQTEGVQYDQFAYRLYTNMGSVIQRIARRKKSAELLNESKTCYITCLQINAEDPQIWNNLGNVHLDLEEYEDATRCFKKAISLDDEYPEAHYCMSLVYEFTQRYQHAIAELKTALKFKKKDKIILNRLTALTFGLKKFDEALEYATRAHNVAPNDFTANKHMMLILYNMARKEDALKFYLEMKRITPDFKIPEIQGIIDDIAQQLS